MSTQSRSQVFVIPPPSFISVHQEETNRGHLVDCLEQKVENGQSGIHKEPSASHNGLLSPTAIGNPYSLFHQHRDSTSTSASDSTDSSPTTTVSTMDSPSVTEPSPGPSPETPPSKLPPHSFPGHLAKKQNSNGNATPGAFFELQRPATPAKRARNLKNLAVNTSGSFGSMRAASTPSLSLAVNPEPSSSAPSSPSFVKPPTPPKRRPRVGLTIQTPSHLPSGPREMRLVIPSTPAVARPNTLRHFQSSPSLPLCSPRSNGPESSVHGPWARSGRPAPNGFAEVPQETEEEEEQEPNFDVPQSREEKPASYPNGPICIYESGVYLYFEPTAQQASDYDVILNVASEVKNPFLADSAPAAVVTSDNGSHSTFSLAVNSDPSLQNAESPSTPKADPLLDSAAAASSLTKPEYIHMPWEHNADIVPDLYKLVKLIDDRVQKGKRVLVHCQCGVSRSASLIVAYGLYKNPGISVQDAYDAVKKRSRWIGPNMNLIMQLQEFRAGLLRAANDPAYYSKVFGVPKSLTPKMSSGAFKNSVRSPAFEIASPASDPPQTAPFSEAEFREGASGGSISPGPSSAPSSCVWSPTFRRSWGPSPPASDIAPSPLNISSATPFVNPMGQLLAAVETFDDQPRPSPSADYGNGRSQTSKGAQESQPMIPREQGLSTVPVHGDVSEFGFSGLTSPRTSEFPKIPFKRTFLDSQSHDVQLPSRPAPTSHPKDKLSIPDRKPRATLSPPSPPRRDRSEPPARLRESGASRGRLRPKFSSPNLQEQFHLQKLQSDLESRLPRRSPMSANAPVEMEALMSPRATEFTSNPFHLTLESPGEPPHSGVPVNVTSEATDEDPRSPAYKGISPITRNIWEVL